MFVVVAVCSVCSWQLLSSMQVRAVVGAEWYVGVKCNFTKLLTLVRLMVLVLVPICSGGCKVSGVLCGCDWLPI